MNRTSVAACAGMLAFSTFTAQFALASNQDNGRKINAHSQQAISVKHGFRGMRLAVDTYTHWVIERIEDDPLSDGELYFINVVDRAGTHPLCPDQNQENLSAIPLAGSWDETGDWQEEGLTFACFDGVLAKCVRWGYAPWGKQDGQELRAYHQTCSRMARADYCGDGVGHTENGTLINIWDEIGIQSADIREDLAFEAAWTPDGAFNIERTRFPEDMDYVRQHCPERLAGGAITGKALIWNESVPR